jgi:hypothetical protein
MCEGKTYLNPSSRVVIPAAIDLDRMIHETAAAYCGGATYA